MIKILAGKWAGRSLLSVSSPLLRPTSVLLRRKIFDAFDSLCLKENILKETIFFCDAFSGTGAVGLEALSRNFGYALFVEQFFKHAECVRKNLNLFPEAIETYDFFQGNFLSESAFSFLSKKYYQKNLQSLLIFLDPPYEKKILYEKSIQQIKEFKKNFENPLILWIESDKKKGPSLKSLEEFLEQKISDIFIQGDHFVTWSKF